MPDETQSPETPAEDQATAPAPMEMGGPEVQAEPPAMGLSEALAKLDHAEDAHWEKDGVFIFSKAIHPNLGVLSELTGREITREEVNNFAPDFKRQDDAPEAPLASLESETVSIVDGDVAHEGEVATLAEGPDPVAMLDAAFNAASPAFIRFNPSFAQVLQQYQAMLPSIREEAERNKVRGRRFGA